MNMAESGHWQMHARSPYGHYKLNDFMLVCFDLQKCAHSSLALNYSRMECHVSLKQYQPLYKIKTDGFPEAFSKPCAHIIKSFLINCDSSTGYQ